MKYLLSLLFTVACATIPDAREFKIGDCAVFDSSALREGQYTEKVPFHVKDVGQLRYVVEFKYNFDGPIESYVLAIKISDFDRDFEKIECPAYYQ